ncbi:MAG TPA: YaiI/YqxD family protein [Pseudogracilibacillus sp.]|nr:YaiI/YqxD family protein [Pseudogracilibacillus sp.]
MRIIIDGDACPVQDEVKRLCQRFSLACIIVKSYDHFSLAEEEAFVQTIYVDQGADAADYEIVKQTKKNDIIITQDYGLASLCLAKGAFVFHHKGFQYTDKNIDMMLEQRHMSAQARKAGARTKGPKPFTKDDRHVFYNKLSRFLENK